MPDVLPDETLEAYYARTSDLWLKEISSEFAEEAGGSKSTRLMDKMSRELCAMFWKKLTAK